MAGPAQTCLQADEIIMKPKRVLVIINPMEEIKTPKKYFQHMEQLNCLIYTLDFVTSYWTSNFFQTFIKTETSLSTGSAPKEVSGTASPTTKVHGEEDKLKAQFPTHGLSLILENFDYDCH